MVKDIVKETELFNYLDFEKRSDQIKFGKTLQRFVGRKFINGTGVKISMEVVNKSERVPRQKLIFKKVD